MRRVSFLTSSLLAGSLVAMPHAHAQSGADTLKQLRGTTRPVIVLSDSRDDPRVARQIAALDHARPGLDERDIKVLRDAEPGSGLRKSLGVERAGFAVVLVGKDGGVKKVWRDVVDPKRIFTIIDQMPMRRQEMRG